MLFKMKKSAILSAILLISLSINAQTIVSSFNKISSLSGNFNATLDENDWFGIALDSLGDLNNDGVNDIVIGAGRDDDGGVNRGAVYILFLNTDGSVQSEQKISSTTGDFTGTLNDGDVFGTAVASIGDLNNDGITDIAVGAEYDSDGGNWSGAVWILFLNEDGTVQSHNKINESDLGVDISGTPAFGSSIANIGDINNDGFVDLAVGSRRDEDGGPYRGAVWILFLDENGEVQDSQKISETQGNFNHDLDSEDFFGCTIANIGDLNSDGITDIAVGAYNDDDGGTNNGAIYILFLDSDGTVSNSQKISTTEGGFNGDLNTGGRLGNSVSPTGDLDGDLIMDLFAGTPKQETIDGLSGAAFIIYLNANGTVKDQQEFAPGLNGFNTNLNDGDLFGKSVAYIGVLGDTKTLIVGASHDDDGGENKGACWVLKLKGTLPSDFNISDATSNRVQLYPNPTSDYIYLKNVQEEALLTIRNAIGQIVNKITIDRNQQVDVSQLKPGTYFISIDGIEQKYQLIINPK